MLKFLQHRIRARRNRRALAWFRNQAEADPYRVTFWLFHVLYVSTTAATVADRGIPDLLASGPKTAGELAEGSGFRGDRLDRVMRALARVGLFTSGDGGRYGLTPYSRLLCSDHPHTLLPWARQCGRLALPDLPFLPGCLENQQDIHEAGHGDPVWMFLTRNPELGEIFDQAMACFTDRHVQAVLDAFDFSAYARGVDVGGGRGALLSGLLQAYPEMTGAIIDRAPVIEQARRVMEDAGTADRCEYFAGDFFEPLPTTGEVFVLKHVLHDWDDESAVRMLRNLAASLTEDRELLIIEGVVREDGSPGDVFRMWWDVFQMAHTRGRERTRNDWMDVLDRAGLRLVDLVHTRLVDVSVLRVRRAS